MKRNRNRKGEQDEQDISVSIHVTYILEGREEVGGISELSGASIQSTYFLKNREEGEMSKSSRMSIQITYFLEGREVVVG
jgi:hypothetical protein